MEFHILCLLDFRKLSQTNKKDSVTKNWTRSNKTLKNMTFIYFRSQSIIYIHLTFFFNIIRLYAN